MERNPIDIVAELVSRINTSIDGKNATAVGNELTGPYLIHTCDPKYATNKVAMNGSNILSVTKDSSGYYVIQTKSEIPNNFSLAAPTYYHGTGIEVNRELQDLLLDRNRPYAFPMIYFPDTRKRTEYPKLSPINMNASVRLVFAIEYDDAWGSEEIKDYCINPMLQLFGEFKKVVNNTPTVSIDRYDIEQFYKLGEKIEGKGTIFSAINDKMSGIVVDFEMDVYHGFVCNCCCEKLLN